MITKFFKKQPENSKKAPTNKAIKNHKPRSGHHSSTQRQKHKSSSKEASWSIEQFPVPIEKGKTRFHDLDLPLELLHAIADLKFNYCSPIQAMSLPQTLLGHDLVGKAQTGTGKTAAFLVTVINDLMNNSVEGERFLREPRALIIAPTRELVMQIADDAKALTKYTKLCTHTLVGGMDYGKQQRALHESIADILVATPGRLLDFCSKQDVFLDQIEIMVIDEADRMLDMGFIPQVRSIIRQTPAKQYRQTMLFSATFTPDVMSLAEQWTIKAVNIEIEPEFTATETVKQYIYLAEASEKYRLLYNLLNQPNVESVLVFANRRDQCRMLHEKLSKHGFSVGLLTGEIPQNKRVTTLKAFKTGKTKILVATDVAGRGIHIDGISHVVNFTLPDEPEDYIHRIGRTGRAGKSGISISFACEDDSFNLLPIEKLLGKKIECELPPDQLLRLTPPPLSKRH